MARLLITPDLFPRLTTDCRVSETPGGVPLPVVLPPVMGDKGMAVVVSSGRKGWITLREYSAIYAADQYTERILLEDAPAFALARCVASGEEGDESLYLQILDGDQRRVLEPGVLYMARITRAPVRPTPGGEPLALEHGSEDGGGEAEIRRAA